MDISKGRGGEAIRKGSVWFCVVVWKVLGMGFVGGLVVGELYSWF